MQAYYEFFTKPKNGMIQIPEHYRDQITDNVLVIILERKPTSFTIEDVDLQRKTDLLSPPVLKTKGWKFNREDANAR